MKVVLGLAVLLGVSASVFAETEAPELWTRMEHYYVNYSLNEDGSNERTYDWAITVLKENALDGVRKSSVTYSTSVEKMEVLEAYTRKADGKRINAPKDNYQLSVNSGREKSSPAFSDRTTLTVVFPEVAVGDTVALRYKITQSEAIFPGHFSIVEEFARRAAFDDVRVTINAPESMKARYKARGMKERKFKDNDRNVVEWTLQNRNPVKSKRRDYSVYDVEREPGYIYSTFSSYKDIADAYAARARPKAVPTERVKKLANEVTAGKQDAHDQAKALYEWVATNISYAGNCIGVGVVVPRDLGFVLDNRMGDCKDHATLLQALLSAKGISSTQALINSGNVYRLPAIPVVSMVNHVINYLPTLNLFLDSTSNTTPFGMLPFQVEDKFVLLMDGFKEGMRTPVTPIGANQERMKTVAKIKSDGTIAAEIEITQKGMYAVRTREGMRNLPKDQEVDLVKNSFQSGGMIASGALHKDDPTALLDTYSYGLKLEIKDYLHRPGAGAFNITPLYGSATPVQHFVWSAMDAEDDVETTCSSGMSSEEYEYEFPSDMQVLAIPDNFSLSNDFLAYKATYRLDGNHLLVKRSFDDKTKGNVCSPELMVAYRTFTQKVMPNMKAQVLYK